MTQMAYCVGIDLGTTYSAAAVCRQGDPRPEIVPLAGPAPSVASMAFLAPDGSMVCGEPALRRAVTDPRRVIREFKRRVGDGTPLVVGGHPVAAEAVAARFVSWVLTVVAEREGGPAEKVALTHPAEWGSHKRDALAAALAEQGVPDVLFLSEPEAAAIGYASTARVEVGAAVAVYDLGGGTFDAAVVRKLADGRFELVGQPVGIGHLGGVDFDQAVFDHVRDAIGPAWDQLDPADPAVQSAVAGLRRECTAAKEALSADTEVMIPVMLPGHHQQVRLGRAEFEEAIRPSVVETVEALRRALDSAGVPTPDAVLMVGGSSRIPLVSQLVSAELGRPVAIDVDPKSVIAVGAAIAARGPIDDATALHPVGAVAPALLDEEPPCPPLDADPAPSEQPVEKRRPRRGPILAIGLAAAVAATFAVAAITLAAGEQPLAAAGAPAAAADADAAAAAATEGAVIDPWTGESTTATTLPGPRRPRAMAAVTRPVARVVSTGAVGASAAAGPARTVDTNPPAGASVPVTVPVGGNQNRQNQQPAKGPDKPIDPDPGDQPITDRPEATTPPKDTGPVPTTPPKETAPPPTTPPKDTEPVPTTPPKESVPPPTSAQGAPVTAAGPPSQAAPEPVVAAPAPAPASEPAAPAHQDVAAPAPASTTGPGPAPATTPDPTTT